MKQTIAAISTFFLLTTFAFAASNSTVTTNKATVTFDKKGDAQVLITKTTSTKGSKNKNTETVSSYESETQNERDILEEIADELDITFRQATAITKFSYQSAKKQLTTNKDNYSVSYKNRGYMTVMTITINNKTEDYWFATKNVREANDRLAKIYGVQSGKLWKALKK